MRDGRGKKDMDCLVLRSDFSWLPFWKEQPGICCRLARITVSTCSLAMGFILHSADQVLGPVKSPDKVLKPLSVEWQREKEAKKGWKKNMINETTSLKKREQGCSLVTLINITHLNKVSTTDSSPISLHLEKIKNLNITWCICSREADNLLSLNPASLNGRKRC